jgi:hypothetical protein
VTQEGNSVAKPYSTRQAEFAHVGAIALEGHARQDVPQAAALLLLQGPESPFAHSEFVHVDPAGQTVHDGPHAPSLLVVSMHEFPHSVRPALQVRVQVLPEHVLVALEEVAHAAHVPAQQIPDGQAVPSAVSPVRTQVDRPVSHTVAPVWHGMPAGVHAVPAVHGVHAPSRQT